MNSKTLLHRQVSSSHIQKGRVTSQAFTPTSKDQSRLSVYDGELISAEESHVHYTEGGLKSFGVLSVGCDECSELGLEARPDPGPFPAHAVVDFGDKTRGQRKGAAKKLIAKALDRGWSFEAGTC